MGSFVVFIDEDCHVNMLEFFESHGYEAYLVRDRFGAGTPDHIIAKAADEIGAVVVTYDADFKRLAGWTTRPPNTRYPNMGVIFMTGLEPDGVMFLEQYMVMIETAHGFVQRRRDPRLLLEVGPRTFHLHDPTG